MTTPRLTGARRRPLTSLPFPAAGSPAVERRAACDIERARDAYYVAIDAQSPWSDAEHDAPTASLEAPEAAHPALRVLPASHQRTAWRARLRLPTSPRSATMSTSTTPLQEAFSPFAEVEKWGRAYRRDPHEVPDDDSAHDR